MKLLSLVTGLLVGHLTLGQSTACQYTDIVSPVHRQLLFQYGVECETALGGFHNDKGIIQLIEYTDSTSQLVWFLSASIDDAYKDNPPTRWSNVGNYIVLIHDGFQSATSKRTKSTPELLACLADVVRDRVYIRPAKAERFIVEQRPGKPRVDKAGNPIRQITRDVRGGNTSNSVYIRFNKDGTYRKVRPV